ncbi:MAG: alkaline phosphatase family protein [Myxococcota bacterium]
MWGRWIVAAGLLLCASCGPSGCREVTRPVESTVQLRLRQIYDAGEWMRRVPVEIAVSLYARAKLDGFVDEIELPDDVRRRLRARIHADDFVDELVPFLTFVYETYQPPEGEAARVFDDHLRAHFAPSDDVPGIEHSMFAWQPEAEEGETPGVALPPGVAERLLTLYDVLYLRDHPRASHVGERLACASRDALPDLRAATRLAEPAIRGLLEVLGERLAETPEIGDAVRAVLDDPPRLEAASAALIRFVDQSVCRNYRFFAARAFRAEQLARYLGEELERPGGGELWAYLEHARSQRRYGVLVVVDGLEGRLLEALARGRAGDPFVQAIAEEQRRAGGAPPRARSLRAAPEQSTRFLEALARDGYRHPHYLPFFRARLADPRTHWVPVGVSTTPTISVRNIPIALTGAPVAGPGGTGLPNFHFVERGYTRDGVEQGRAWYFFGSDAAALTELTERAGMRSLFERLPELSSMSCAAQYDEHAHYGIDALLNLGLGEAVRDFGERLCATELERRAEAERRLRALRGQLLAKRDVLSQKAPWYRPGQRYADRQDRELALRWIAEIARLEQRTLPELLVVYDPWPDHFAHFEGPFADEIVAPSGELNRLDYWLGRFARAYRDVRSRTVFGLAGDHGLSPVFHLLNPEVEIFDALREEGVDFRVEKISSDEGEGPKLTNPFAPPSMKGIDVVVASTAGGNYMLDLFADQGGGFTRQPLAAELRALRPLASPDAEPVDLLHEITTRLADSLDYLAVREEPCTPQAGAVRLLGTRDGAPAAALVRRRGDRIHLTLEGADLLDTGVPSPYADLGEAELREHASIRHRCLAASAAAPESWCRSAEWRRLASFTPRPDAVVQIAHLYDSPRAGTINLFPRDGVGYNSVVPGRHAGESFHEKNALVAVWGEPLAERPGGGGLRSAVNGAVPLALYEYLSGERPVRGEDGWGHAPLPRGWLRPGENAP